MNHMRDIAESDHTTPMLPHWIIDGSVAQTPENAGFSSGAALGLMHAVLNDPYRQVPVKLLTAKFALKAAVRCLTLQRQGLTEKSTLDAYLLTQIGDHWGPAGDMLDFWTKATAIKIGGRGWQNKVMPLIPDHMREDVYDWIDFTWEDRQSLSPVAAASDMLATAIEAYPREEAIAFMLADLRLARDLNWPSLFPFMAQHLTGKELRGSRDNLLIESHRSVYTVATNAVRMAFDLTRRAERLRAIAPKLRTKHSDEALELFLSEVAIAPSSMLAPRIKGTNIAMTARAARRFCDRLVQLGVAHELTGRETFRLYGLAP